MNILGVSIPILSVILVFLGVMVGLLVLILKRGSSHGSEIVETGLKAVDLCVPIPLGGDVLLSGEPHAGVRILGTELAYRLANSPRRPFRVIIFLDSELDDLENVCKELRETLPALKQIFVAPVVTAEDVREQRVQGPVSRRDALFAISKNARFVHEFRQAVKTVRQVSQSTASLTTFTVTESMSPEGFETRLENLRPGALNDVDWSFNSDQSKRAAVQALRFMSQPYFTAEPYTGLKSAYVPVGLTIKAFETILSGRYLDLPPKSFQFQNALMPKLGQTA
jgi:hypothetical protein